MSNNQKDKHLVNRNSLFVHSKQIHTIYAENIFYNNFASVRAKPAKSD
jgi:hypothetical protein